jgi:sugar-phosphatase
MPRHTTLTVKAVLLDMDGTLVDSLAVVETIWTMFAERFGLDPLVVLDSVHGVRAGDSIARFAPPGTDVRALEAELVGFELENSGQTVEIRGASSFIRALPSGAVGVVTSCSRELAMRRMSGAGVPVPSVLIAAEDVVRGKPFPDGFLLGAEALCVAPGDIVVFEDAEAGITAALAAGMQVVVVGDYEGVITEGLPRILDYRDIALSTAEGEISIKFLTAAP